MTPSEIERLLAIAEADQIKEAISHKLLEIYRDMPGYFLAAVGRLNRDANCGSKFVHNLFARLGYVYLVSRDKGRE